jgi:gliding motility-associated-like protein
MGYPVSLGAYQTVSGGGWDIGIIKYDSSGINRLYATYLGGSSTDIPHSIVVNKANQLLILGTTGSSDYPVKSNAYDTSFSGGTNIALDNVLQYPNGSDIVVSKLSTDGSQLLASTFIGGSGNDGLNFLPHYNNMLMFGNDTLYYKYGDGVRGEIITDNQNNVYVGTCTFSTDFPGTSNGFQTSNNGKQEGIVFKMDFNLTNLIWSSYLGGSENDAIYSIDNNSDYDVYVTGGTTSLNFPTTNGAYKTSYQGGSADGFISRISQNGNILKASSYFGSNKYDQSYFVRIGKDNNVFITGQTRADSNILIYNAPFNVPNSGQFITKIKPNLDSLIWSTVVGTGDGKPNISPTAFAVDICNRIYLVGWGRYWGDYTYNGVTYSWGTVFGTVNMPITSNAYQSVTDGQDFYIIVISNDASSLEYATFFGEIHTGPNYSGHDHVDGGTSRFDRKGTVYQSVCASCGGFNLFPTFPANVWSPTNGSLNCNNAVFKFKIFDNFALADFVDPITGCAPDTVHFINASLGNSFIWDFGDGSPVSTQNNPIHVYTNAGVYFVKLIVFMPNGCISTDTIIKQIVILDDTTYSIPDAHMCYGDNIQIGINPVNNPNYTYNWTPSTYLSDNTIANPFTNTPTDKIYRLIVSNGSCSDTIFQTVKVHKMIVDAGNDTLVCSDTVKLTAHTNEFPVHYIWSSNSNFTDTLNNVLTDSSVLINFTNNTYYYVKITNDWCEGIDSVHVGFSILTSPSVINHPTCTDSCNGSISIIPLGGTPPYTFQWNTGQNTSTINNLCPGTYTVTITDSVNCKSIKTINLINPPPLVLNKVINNIPCPTACIGSIQTNVTGGTSPYQYSWSNGSNQSSLNSLCAGKYSLTLTDSKSCKLYDTTEIVVSSPFNNVTAWADKDTIFKDLNTQLHVTGVNNVNIQWIPSIGLNNPFSFNPIASPQVTTTYYFTLTDPYGCTYTDSLIIYVIDQKCDEPYIFIPNAFTPNNDLQNDVFLVRSEILEEMNIKIFDRWGEKVFESNNINYGWDGRYKGELLQPTVYVYYFKGKCQNQKFFEKKGNVTLIR